MEYTSLEIMCGKLVYDDKKSLEQVPPVIRERVAEYVKSITPEESVEEPVTEETTVPEVPPTEVPELVGGDEDEEAPVEVKEAVTEGEEPEEDGEDDTEPKEDEGEEDEDTEDEDETPEDEEDE